LFLDLGTRKGWGVSVTPRPLSPPRKHLVPIVQEAGWASLDRCGKSRPYRDSLPQTAQPVTRRYTDWATGLRWDGTTSQISTYISFIILRLLRWSSRNNYELVHCESFTLYLTTQLIPVLKLVLQYGLSVFWMFFK
jgi:hypothetical protein